MQFIYISTVYITSNIKQKIKKLLSEKQHTFITFSLLFYSIYNFVE